MINLKKKKLVTSFDIIFLLSFIIYVGKYFIVWRKNYE